MKNLIGFIVYISVMLFPVTSKGITIDTTINWDGSHSYCCVGEVNDEATMGQTFVVPSSANILNDFSFWLGHGSGQPIFSAYVMKWESTKAIGPILYESEAQSIAGSSGLTEYRFDTGDIALESDAMYIAFLSASNYYDNSDDHILLGRLNNFQSTPNPLLDGGGLWRISNGDDFTRLTELSWSGPSTEHLAFTANFVSPVPIPAPLWLFGSGLLGLIGIAGKSQSQRTIKTTNHLCFTP
jgi:hypothetical protein